RELFWKSIHNIFRVGDFWTHMNNLEEFSVCHTCGVPENLEHIAMECDDVPAVRVLYILVCHLPSLTI
ncbi:hypothetical protein B0H10DRAFT_1843667, partial [Mycena sp. CBHHK59/15]